MNGTLFKYGPSSAQLAFKTPATRPRSQPPGGPSGELHLVLVGGLIDGLLFAPYAQQLASAVGDLGWSLVQAQLTSSYQGWGLASLDQDASELHLLSQHLATQHNSRAWVLMGHSTGCQDAVRYVQKHLAQDCRLAGVILQAPVSDREYLAEFPSWQEQVPRAQALIQQGKPEEVVFRVMEWDGAAVTARRLVDLCCPQGDDDMFSTDLTREQLQPIVGPLHSLPLLMLVSELDEAVPEQLRQSGAVAQLMERMLLAVQDGASSARHSTVAAAAAAAEGCPPPSPQPPAATGLQAGSSSSSGGVGVQKPRPLQKWVGIAGAGHACKGQEEAVVEQVCRFLQQLPVSEQLQP